MGDIGELGGFWGGIIVWGAVLAFALIAGIVGGERQ
jgi:hypothetical protein